MTSAFVDNDRVSARACGSLAFGHLAIWPLGHLANSPMKDAASTLADAASWFLSPERLATPRVDGIPGPSTRVEPRGSRRQSRRAIREWWASESATRERLGVSVGAGPSWGRERTPVCERAEREEVTSSCWSSSSPSSWQPSWPWVNLPEQRSVQRIVAGTGATHAHSRRDVHRRWNLSTRADPALEQCSPEQRSSNSVRATGARRTRNLRRLIAGR